MKANNYQINFNYDRKKELHKQQEKLKAMANSSNEAHLISADLMIDNLLKNSLAKLPQEPLVNQMDQSNSELPLWLQCESSAVPGQYKYLWSIVESSANLADTQKVSQLLLTSGLPVDVLGFIWNLANKAIPGQLTKQEFYIVLALVSLAQNGYKFNDIRVLKSVSVPSIPFLKIDSRNFSTPKSYSLQSPQIPKTNEFFNAPGLQPKFSYNFNESFNNTNFVSNVVTETALIGSSKTSFIKDESNIPPSMSSSSSTNVSESSQTPGLRYSFPSAESTSTSELEDDFSPFQSGSSVSKDKNDKPANKTANDFGDDFTEFQSADIEPVDPFQIVVINQRKEAPKISLPKTLTGKFSTLKSNMLKISPETEKKLKELPAPESLSSLPESKISSSNKVSTSLSVLGNNHGIGSRLANHSLNSRPDKPKCHKHHKIKINPITPPTQSSDEEIILGVKAKNLETVIPKCRPKYLNACQTFALKETKIGNDISEPSCSKHPGNEPESFTGHAGENTRQIEIPMLGTFNETVFPTQAKSQTVDLISVQEDKYSALREIELELNKDSKSDLGEVNDDFGDFLSADIPDSVPLANEKSQDLVDWNFNTATNSTNSFNLATTTTDNIIDVKEVGNDFFDTFNLLTVKENDNQTSQTNSNPVEQQDNIGLSSKENTVSDLMKPSENICANTKPDQTFDPQSDNDFWEFFNNDIKPPNEENFGRHGSLPSLDLKISTTDEYEQEAVWRKCIDACYSLIQDGYNIFNNINTKSVLDEVFAAPKTEDYLNHLNTVFQISNRVCENFSHVPSSQEELEKFWGRLQDLCFEYNIRLKRDDSASPEGTKCSICSRHTGYSVITQGTSSYHSTCANLWINCVETTLPFSI